jgi:selenocysteine-specific elongation factor
VTSIADAVIWGASPELSDADLRSAQRLHIGTAAIGCRVRPLAPDVPGGRTDRGVPDLPAGAIAVRIRAEAALPLRVGDRLLLTGTGAQRVLAGGIVCDPQPVTPRGRTARARHVNTLLAIGAAVRNGDADALVHGLLASHDGFRGLEELRETLGLDADTPVTVPGTLTLGEALALSDRLEGLPEAIASLGPHVHSPDELGDVLMTLGLPRRAVGAIIDHLVAAGLIRRTALGLVVEHHADAAESARSSRYVAVVQRIEASPFDPPDFRRVADEEGLDHRERVQLLASDRVVRCGELVIGSAAFARAINVLRQLDGDGNGFTAAQARDALGSTRRVTVPILEEMLRRGLTRFDGTRHTLARVPD